jgi:hypothetical protein
VSKTSHHGAFHACFRLSACRHTSAEAKGLFRRTFPRRPNTACRKKALKQTKPDGRPLLPPELLPKLLEAPHTPVVVMAAVGHSMQQAVLVHDPGA